MTLKSWKDKLKETAEQAKELSHDATTKAFDLSQGASVKAREDSFATCSAKQFPRVYNLA